jgi:hypothetical protein
MIGDDYTGYGMREGQLFFITDVPRGAACGCRCVRCSQPLVAKKGSIRRHHFAHLEVTSCHGAAESVLHLLAKELIAELDVLVVPQYMFAKQRRTKAGALVRHQALVAKGGSVPVHNVRVEECAGDFVPDVIIESGSKSLIVEVAVTHKVARAKLRRIRRRNLPAIEIRLDPSDSLLRRETLKTKLQRDLTSKVWLFHPAQREAERVFVSKFRDALARSRTRSLPANPRHFAIRSSSADRSSSQPPLSQYDRTAEEFHRTHHRYPTMEECLRLWPHLWKP